MSGFFLRAHKEDARLASRLQEQGTTGHTAIDWAVPFDEIAKRYPSVEEEMGVSGIQGGKLAPLAEHPITAQAEETARKLGLPIERTPRDDGPLAALAFKIAEDELGIPQLLDAADVTAADAAVTEVTAGL